MTSFDFDTAYRVEGYGGVAWWALRHPTTRPECQGHPDDGTFDAPIGETFYCDGSCEEPVENLDRVICRMVGDDRDFDLDVEDLTPITRDEFCPGCGQIGCGHYA